MIEVSHSDALLIYGAMKEKHEQAVRDLRLLTKTRYRDLLDEERERLPLTLMHLPREQLRDQIDACTSLTVTLNGILKDFDPDLF